MFNSTNTNQFDAIPAEEETGKLATMTTEESEEYRRLADLDRHLDAHTDTICLRY